jgi:fluoroacetyl-CoA thioesterase
MKPIELGQRLSFRIETQYRDTAEAFGNANVRVVGTPALVGFLETAADRCLMPCYEAKEGSVGTSIELAHLAAAPEGSVVDASAEVIGVDGRRVRFAVEARRGEVLLMKGHHERAVVDLERFLAKVAAQQ